MEWPFCTTFSFCLKCPFTLDTWPLDTWPFTCPFDCLSVFDFLSLRSPLQNPFLWFCGNISSVFWDCSYNRRKKSFTNISIFFTLNESKWNLYLHLTKFNWTKFAHTERIWFIQKKTNFFFIKLNFIFERFQQNFQNELSRIWCN